MGRTERKAAQRRRCRFLGLVVALGRLLDELLDQRAQVARLGNIRCRHPGGVPLAHGGVPLAREPGGVPRSAKTTEASGLELARP